MSVIIHTRHSVQLLEYITRRFNGVIGYQLIKVNSNNVEIKFPVYPHSNQSVIIALFTKLASAFVIIKGRYLQKQDNHKHVQVKLNQKNEFSNIRIKGSLYIPSSKFLKLYNLVLWYYVKFITGQKPSLSNKGNKISEAWRKEEKMIKNEINSLPRIPKVSFQSHNCNICGEETYNSNIWKLKETRLSSGYTISTFVCTKHHNKLI